MDAKRSWARRNRDKRNKLRKANYDQTKRVATRRYQKWSEFDTLLVMESQLTDRQLAHKIGRSVQAIQAKRNEFIEYHRKQWDEQVQAGSYS